MKYIYFIFFISVVSTSFGQGCSDAGFCTIDAVKPADNISDSTKRKMNQLKIGVSYGKGFHSTTVIAGYAEYNRKFGEKWGLDTKITWVSQNGNAISTFGVSDLFLNANYSATSYMKVIFGAKIPLSSSNSTKNGLALPMDYQLSLGTLDGIVGFGFTIKKFQIIAAYQQPLTQNNNQFDSNLYPIDHPLYAFQSTRNFKRGGDILVRLSYPFTIKEKFKITPSVLPIYHLTNDRYTYIDPVNPTFLETREIANSQGLTLNLNAYFDYTINAKNAIQLNIGAPVIVRKSRPDGLTRSFVANLEYRFKF